MCAKRLVKASAAGKAAAENFLTTVEFRIWSWGVVEGLRGVQRHLLNSTISNVGAAGPASASSSGSDAAVLRLRRLETDSSDHTKKYLAECELQGTQSRPFRSPPPMVTTSAQQVGKGIGVLPLR